MPKISVIVLNYNGLGLIACCLEALEKQSFKDFEIVIVDNASLDGSADEIRKFLIKSPIACRVKLISLDQNLGFAGGNIEGLRVAEGEHIALLNNDTKPEENWLGELFGAMESDPKVGICASKLLLEGSNRIDSAGDGFLPFLKGFKRGEGEKDFSYKQREYIFGACAGAALYRRKMIEEVGFLDDDFFLIHEDTDLNLRAHLYGWKVLFAPEAIVYHRVRSTIGKMSDTAVYYTLRNCEFVRIKNIPIGVFVSCFLELMVKTILEFMYFALKHKNINLYLRAKIDALKMFPRMIKKRRKIMKNRKVDNRYLRSLMTPIWEKGFWQLKIKKFLQN